MAKQRKSKRQRQPRQVSQDQSVTELRQRFNDEYRNDPRITWEGYLRGWNAVGSRLGKAETQPHTQE